MAQVQKPKPGKSTIFLKAKATSRAAKIGPQKLHLQGQVSQTTTTTTTEGSGTITHYQSGHIDCAKGNKRAGELSFRQTVTYVTRSGTALDEDAVRTKIKVGVPVRVHYVRDGDDVVIRIVSILDQD